MVLDASCFLQIFKPTSQEISFDFLAWQLGAIPVESSHGTSVTGGLHEHRKTC